MHQLLHETDPSTPIILCNTKEDFVDFLPFLMECPSPIVDFLKRTSLQDTAIEPDELWSSSTPMCIVLNRPSAMFSTPVEFAKRFSQLMSAGKKHPDVTIYILEDRQASWMPALSYYSVVYHIQGQNNEYALLDAKGQPAFKFIIDTTSKIHPYL